MSQQKGFAAESIAKDYLLAQGLTWRASNYHSRMGEIDLIMQYKEYVVFVEVRSRSSNLFGGAIESITPSKRHKIMKTASGYMQQHTLHYQYVARFDVLVLQGHPAIIQWIPNAFGLDF